MHILFSPAFDVLHVNNQNSCHVKTRKTRSDPSSSTHPVQPIRLSKNFNGQDCKGTRSFQGLLVFFLKSKDGISRDLSTLLQSDAYDEAKKYINGDFNASSLPDRIEGALLARHRPFQKAVVESKHGAELHNEHHRLCGDIMASYRAQFQKLLTSALREDVKKGEINLKSANLSASNITELLNLAVAGLRQGAADVTTFEKRVHHFIKITMAGIQHDRPPN